MVTSPKTSATFQALLLGILLSLGVLNPWPAGLWAETAEPDKSSFFIEATRWTEAERLFRSDPRWRGGDGASSVDLGGGRVLWLFGDSFIDLSASGSRRLSDLVRNSIAIQTGYDPAGAAMDFYWKMEDGKPSAFFARKGENWYWPASGIMVGRRLLIFLMEIGDAENGLGFEARGWKGVWIDNPHEEPERWKLTYLVSPQKQGLVVGSGTPLIENGFLHVFAADEKDRAVYLVRWPEGAARSGTLTAPRWWAGERAGWVGPKAGMKLRPVMSEGQMEFTVESRPRLKRYFQVQTLSILNPCLAISTAPAITGPWSPRRCFFTPPEQSRPDLLVYAGKSHPALGGAEMVFTYVANTTVEERLLGDMAIYFPALLRGRIEPDRFAEE